MMYCWTTITTKSMDESIRFYTEIVKLDVKSRYQAGPDVEIAFLGDGETKIELIYNRTTPKTEIGESISIGFEVDSVEKMMSFMNEKGLAIHSGPFQPNPHVKFFYVLDPNGLKVQFVENIR